MSHSNDLKILRTFERNLSKTYRRFIGICHEISIEWRLSMLFHSNAVCWVTSKFPENDGYRDNLTQNDVVSRIVPQMMCVKNVVYLYSNNIFYGCFSQTVRLSQKISRDDAF